MIMLGPGGIASGQMVNEPPREALAAKTGKQVSVRAVTHGFVLALSLLLILGVGAIAAVRLMASDSVSQLQGRWVPAQTSAVSLAAAYVDEETGERGFLLAGQQQFLAPFYKGQREASRLETKLTSLLASDPHALARLSDVMSAHSRWQVLAEKQIATRRRRLPAQKELTAMALAGKQRFDRLRTRLTALTDRINTLAQADLDRIASLNTDADLASILALVLAIAVAGLAVPALRRVLVRPLESLIDRIRRVAGGEYGESIPADGPPELAAIAKAVERMRQSILRGTDDLLAARQALTLRAERDRIAADLHDLTIQRVFGLGLMLSAEVSRGGEHAVRLRSLIDETDRIIRELRGVIFEVSEKPAGSLRTGVSALVQESSRALGFTPDVEFRGPVDHAGPELSDELLAVLHEALSNVVRHAAATEAAVTVSLDARFLFLSVSDNGTGLSPERVSGRGLRNMEARAAGLGGKASITGAPGAGTTVQWTVPLSAISPKDQEDRATIPQS